MKRNQYFKLMIFFTVSISFSVKSYVPAGKTFGGKKKNDSLPCVFCKKDRKYEVLFELIHRGKYNTIKRIIEHRVREIDNSDPRGRTATIFDDINFIVNGRNAYDIAISYDTEKHKKIAELLASYGGTMSSTALIDAVKEKNLDTVKALINAGFNLEERGYRGYTPLSRAFKIMLVDGADDEIKKIIRFLVQKGANVHAWNFKGKTCLHKAIGRHKHPKKCDRLSEDEIKKI